MNDGWTLAVGFVMAFAGAGLMFLPFPLLFVGVPLVFGGLFVVDSVANRL